MSVSLEGPIRTCLELKRGPSGYLRCARWTPMRCERAADGGCDPKMCQGADHTYLHPSAPEGETEAYPAVYKLVEADDLITSHREDRNFTPDPRYPEGVQDRDYENPKGQDQIAVIRNAQRLQPGRVISDAVTPVEGPPIVTDEDIVLSGNSRTMSIRYAATMGLPTYKRYRATLEKRAPQFGFNKADVGQFAQPVLVRVVDLPPDDISKFASYANKPVGRELDPIGKGIELSKLIPDSLVMSMVVEEGETFRQFLDTARGRAFVDIVARQSTPTERARLLEETGDLNETGKKLIEDALFAKVFPDRRTLQALPAQTRRALVYSLPVLLQNKAAGLPRDWDLNVALRDAVEFAAKHLKGVKLQDYIRQMAFFGKEDIDPESLQGKTISLIGQHGTQPRVLRAKLQRYVNAAEWEHAPKLITVEPQRPGDVMQEIITSIKEEDGESPALFGLDGLGQIAMKGVSTMARKRGKCIRFKQTRRGRRCAKFSGSLRGAAGSSGGGGLAGRTMREGTCRTTRKGQRYCKIPGVGVRFVAAGVSGVGKMAGDLSGRVRKCVRFKQTRAGRRCAKFRPLYGAAGRVAGGGVAGGLSGRRLGVGQCRRTGRGQKYCNVRGKGVRFVRG